MGAVARYPCLAHRASVVACGLAWSCCSTCACNGDLARPDACGVDGPPGERHRDRRSGSSPMMMRRRSSGRIAPSFATFEAGGVGPLPRRARCSAVPDTKRCPDGQALFLLRVDERRQIDRASADRVQLSRAGDGDDAVDRRAFTTAPASGSSIRGSASPPRPTPTSRPPTFAARSRRSWRSGRSTASWSTRRSS